MAEKLIVEAKALECILPVHKAQLPTYLRITGTPVGLLINFNSPVLKDGIARRSFVIQLFSAFSVSPCLRVLHFL